MQNVTASKLVKAFITLNGFNNVTIYNDKRTFGRSIKIWGINNNKEIYNEINNMLKEKGFNTKVIKTRDWKRLGIFNYGGNYRLWIKE